MQIPFHVEPSLQVVAHVQPSADTAHCAYTLTVEVRPVTFSGAVMRGLAWLPAPLNCG
jgi:hypothetical protein